MLTNPSNKLASDQIFKIAKKNVGNANKKNCTQVQILLSCISKLNNMSKKKIEKKNQTFSHSISYKAE